MINIYLDIDGVLLTNELRPANYANEFLGYVLRKYPDTTYWLTTHCQGDASRPVRDIGHLFNDYTVELIKRIKPTTWLTSSAKTDAIDFSKPFLWFDDELLLKERLALEVHNALDNWIEVNLRKYPNQLQMFVDDFPVPLMTID